MQRSRTWVRVVRPGSDIKEGKDLQVENAPKVGASNIRGRWLEADLPKKRPQKQRRALCTALQDLLKNYDPLLDQFGRRHAPRDSF